MISAITKNSPKVISGVPLYWTKTLFSSQNSENQKREKRYSWFLDFYVAFVDSYRRIFVCETITKWLQLYSHKKKRQKQIKKLMQRGLLDPEKVDPFQLFLETGGLTHCLYKDSERILGNTFGMCVLQVKLCRCLLL